MRSLIFASVALVSLNCVAPACAQSILNGGFETGDLTGWTQFGNPGGTSVMVCGGGCAQSGMFGVNLGAVGTPGGIEQTLATTAGQTYQVFFWLLNHGGSPSSFTANFGGTTLLALTDPPAFGYTPYSMNAVATSSSTLLQFGARNDPAYFSLDSVSIQSVTGSVPEPSAWALMLLGFGALGVAMRRAKATARTFA